MAVSASPVLRNLRKTLGGAKYKALVTEAHKRGYKAESYATGKAQGLPEGMIERTTTSLRKEATSAVGAAFKPAETALTTAMERESAIQSKRERDLKEYQQWSTGQMQRFQQAAMAAQGQILTQNQAIMDEVSTARQQNTAALDQQHSLIAGQGDASQARLAMDPTSQTAQAQATTQVATAGSRVADAANDAVGGSLFNMANQLNWQAALQQTTHEKGTTRRQEFVDRITELHGQKAKALTDTMAGLTDNEQKKVISQYEASVDSAIASGKQAFTASESALDRATTNANKDADRKTKVALANAKADADAAKFEAKNSKDAVAFKAKYGATQEEIAAMTPAELRAHQKAYRTATGGGKGPQLTPSQKQDNTISLEKAIREVRKKKGRFSESVIRRNLRAGRTEERDPTFGNVTKGAIAGLHPDIVNAAIDIVFREGLSDTNRRRIADELGINPRSYGRAKRKKHAPGAR